MLSIVIQVSKLKLIQEDCVVSVEIICVKLCEKLIVFHKRVSNLNHEKAALLRRSVEASVVKKQDARSVRLQRVPAQLYDNRVHALVLGHHCFNPNKPNVAAL